MADQAGTAAHWNATYAQHAGVLRGRRGPTAKA